MNTLTETNVRLIASSKSWVEGEAVRQLYATANLPGVRLAVGLPDLHPGRGHPIGAAIVTEGIIYPHLLGGDIGCGMALFRTDLLRRKAKFDRWAEFTFDLEHPWEGDVRERLEREDLGRAQFTESFGTLGGGNHFAELQAVEKVFDKAAFNALDLATGNLALLVHSGSRGLGLSVLETHIEEHGAGGVNAESDAATRYLLGHDHAVRWAAGSRALLAQRFLDTLGASGGRVLDACHNSVACRHVDGATLWIHRKGAAPADKGPLVIPGSRGTLSYLVQPLGEGEASAWSLAHGAGRRWTRSESRQRVRERFHRDELVQTGLGGRVVCDDRNLLYEEAPMAYKNIEAVIADLVEAGLIAVIATLRPLLTYKTRAIRR